MTDSNTNPVPANKTGTMFILGDSLYDWLKKFVTVFIPAASSAYYGLANVWGLPSPEQVVGSLAILATFLGVLLHLSNSQFVSSGAAYDGTVHVTPTDTGSTVTVHVDPTDLVTKQSVNLQVVPPPQSSTPSQDLPTDSPK